METMGVKINDFALVKKLLKDHHAELNIEDHEVLSFCERILNLEKDSVIELTDTERTSMEQEMKVVQTLLDEGKITNEEIIKICKDTLL